MRIPTEMTESRRRLAYIAHKPAGHLGLTITLMFGTADQVEIIAIALPAIIPLG
jgi:hypothetical protein